MAWCDNHPGWHFRLRLKANQQVTLPDGPRQALADLHLRRGIVRFLHGVLLGVEGYGPVDIAMAWVDRPDAEPWYLATDEKADQRTLTEYSWRMDIDESFKDDKSGGFQLEDCELGDAESVSRLLLVMAVACLYLVSLGTFVVETEQRQTVDSHWRRGLSYFQIGWRWLRRLIYQADVIPGCSVSALTQTRHRLPYREPSEARPFGLSGCWLTVGHDLFRIVKCVSQSILHELIGAFHFWGKR
jgi:hypothetical protein